MKADWKKVKLGDFIELHRGYDLTKDSFIKGPYPVVCSTSIMGYHNSYKVKGPGVIIGRSGTLGQVQYVKENYWPHNTSLYVSDFKNNDVLFVRYFLQNIGTDSVGGGSAVPTLNRNHLSILDIVVPPLETQQKIASILSAYDDLIENNRKQIKLLEEAAQRLYKEWFVDLRFPGYENVAIVDGVPEGWITKTIGEICVKLNSGGTPNRKKTDYWDSKDIKWYKTKELQDCWLFDSEEYISEKGLNNSSAKVFPKNTILMAIYASPTLGRLGILTDEATCNQAALCMIADNENTSYQWLYLKLYELRDFFNSVARGAGQQNISADVVKNKQIILPNKNIMEKFTITIDPYFEKIKSLQQQIQLLQQARDKLLPRLMSGEMEV